MSKIENNGSMEINAEYNQTRRELHELAQFYSQRNK